MGRDWPDGGRMIMGMMAGQMRGPAVVSGLAWSDTDKTPGMTTDELGKQAIRPATGGSKGIRSAAPIPAGKSYFEIELLYGVNNGINATTPGLGLATLGSPLNLSYADIGQFLVTSQGKFNGDSAPFGVGETLPGDIYGFALDSAAGKLYVSRNGAWALGGSPSAGTGALATSPILSGEMYAIFTFATNASSAVRLRTTENGLIYPVPSGFFAI